MTEYDVSNCSSSNATHSNQSKGQATTSSVQENDLTSENGTNNDGTVDYAYNKNSNNESDTEGINSEGEDDDYADKSAPRKNSSKSSYFIDCLNFKFDLLICLKSKQKAWH